MKRTSNILRLIAAMTIAIVALTMPQQCLAAGKRKVKVISEEQATKPLSYNKLLKSHDYETMYDRALEYFNFRKKNRKGEMVNTYNNYVKTAALLERATPRFGGTEREDSVAYYLATSYYKQGDFLTSAYMFDNFRKRFPRSVFIEDVTYMYALSYYYASPAPEYDQTTTLQAMVAIHEYLERYPASKERQGLNDKLDELQQKLYDKSYMNARVYYKIGEYKAAVTAISNAIDKYPKSNHREELLYLVTRSQYNLARNSVDSKKTDRYLDVMDRCYSFLGEYPESKYAKESNKMLSEAKEFIAEQKLDRSTEIVVKENENRFLQQAAQASEELKAAQEEQQKQKDARKQARKEKKQK
ncbi:MAG: outer membrane protein assembly factor BamD [Rikenellaceae bacterium]|nr:outer membrane protein assembly factor BamD [Rikenellaceae bacterium]